VSTTATVTPEPSRRARDRRREGAARDRGRAAGAALTRRATSDDDGAERHRDAGGQVGHERTGT
jgi:hypothetical protein